MKTQNVACTSIGHIIEHLLLSDKITFTHIFGVQTKRLQQFHEAEN